MMGAATRDPTRTTCPYCGVGCGVLATPDGQGGASIAGDPEHPANFGRLCVKGSALGETLDVTQRLLHPLIDGQRTTWNRALNRVAKGFRDTLNRYGPDSVAVYLSGQLLTEDYYVANKLMKGYLGSANVDTNSRLCMASSVAGHRRAFGSDTVPNCYEDLDEADLIVLVGSNAAWCHPVLYQRMQAARESRGTRIINIDPRRTATSEGADLHVSIRPGMDAMLFSHLFCEIGRRGALDPAFIATGTTGFQAAYDHAGGISPDLDQTARACGLDARDVEQFVDWWISTPRVVTCYSQGVNQSAQGTDKVNAILNCHLATGRIGKVGSGPLSLTGQPNAMGGREVGGLANQLAAHMGFTPSEIDRVRRFWGAPNMAQREGLKAVDMFDAVAAGRIKALWIMCTNPAVSLPRADQVRGALSALDLLVVSESHAHVDGLLERAHVVLPAAPWGEKDGTVTNSERRISRQRAFLPPTGEAKPDWWIVCEVAKRLGFDEAFSYDGPAAIFREHAALSGFENNGQRVFDIGGLSRLTTDAYDRISPIQWPVNTAALNGTKRLFSSGQFTTVDSYARFIAIDYPGLKATPTSERPFLLNTGRVRDQWHTMSRTGLSPRLGRHAQEPFLGMNPSDAAQYGIAEGDHVDVASTHGQATLSLTIDPGLPRGMVFAPIHWNDLTSGGARIGALVHPFNDRLSGQPESKATPVSVTPAHMRSHGLLVSRQRVVLPRWLVHARVALQGAEAVVFASRQAPDAIAALMGNLLPASGQRLALEDPEAQRYRSAVVAGKRLLAALYVAPAREPGLMDFVAEYVAKPALTPADHRALLVGRDLAGMVDLGPVICACHGVRQAVIMSAMSAGAADVAGIGARCGAGTNCGSCKPELARLLRSSETKNERVRDAAGSAPQAA
jgi:assimilatory nitrate reductase catalytic subunit